MDNLIDFNLLLDNFCGTARIMPFPNLVLFPNAIQPLHIYERRYCLMLEEALRSDHLVAIGLLDSGWENNYEGCPPIASTLCLGRVVSVSQQKEGHYNLLLAGIRRARLLHEFSTPSDFRSGRIELLEDYYPPGRAHARQQLKRELLDSYLDWLPRLKASEEYVQQLHSSKIPLGALIDILASSMPIEFGIKQSLLEELDVDRRAQQLIHILQPNERGSFVESEFPPRFSRN